MSKSTAADALRWMNSRKSSSETFLFRGQTSIYPTIKPSVFREHIDDGDRHAWLRTVDRFVAKRGGVTGYQINEQHDAIALIQHYLVKSPVIDLTGTPEIALYFSLLGQDQQADRVVYAIKKSCLENDTRQVADHDFLTEPVNKQGLMARWLRQDGFTFGMKNWKDYAGASNLDLLKVPGIEAFEFVGGPGDTHLVEGLGDLETIKNDPLARRVRSVFMVCAKDEDKDRVSSLMPETGTIDATDELIAEIDLLIATAAGNRQNKDVTELQKIRSVAGTSTWDVSWSAGVSFYKKKLGL